MFNRNLLVMVAGAGTVVALVLAAGCSEAGFSADAGNDANAIDAGLDAVADAKPPKDSAPLDSQPMCPTPGDVSKFAPPALVPARPATDSCGTTGVQGYWDACRSAQATQMGCATWKAANVACAGCIESQRSDSAWGALVMANGITFLNVAGCIALLGDVPCAKAYQDASLCEGTACDAMCPVTDFFDPGHVSTLASRQKCAQSAAATVCASYEKTAASSCVKDAGTAAAVCLSFTSFVNGYFQYAAMFCSAGG